MTVRVRSADHEGAVYLEDILTEQPSMLIGGGHYLIIAMFLTLIIVASIVNVDMIIMAPGRLMADTPPVVVQPIALSVIREIRVKAGDLVHKGDVLATLDRTFTQADSGTLTSQRDALHTKIQRLEAELTDTPYVAGVTPEDQLQYNLYMQRKSQYAARLLGFTEELHRYQSNIDATEQNRISSRHQLDIVKQVEMMRAELFQKQVGSKLNYLDSQASRMRAERDTEDVDARLHDLQHFLQSSEATRQVFIDEWRRQLLEDLSKARYEFGQINAGLVKAKRLDDLVVLLAPSNGIVLEVAARSVGSVLNAAEALFTIVSTDKPLIADVMINSADVGYAKQGDDVVIKVDAFPFTQHGMLKGRLRSIGQDSSSPNGASANLSIVGQGPGVFHRSSVELTDTTLTAMPPGTRLFPGMSVTAEIKVGTRSVISYFLNPIIKGFHESIREP